MAKSEEYRKKFYFANKKWPAVYSHLFDENKYVGNAAFELVNNLLLSEEIVATLLAKKGYRGQMKQIFDLTNSFVDRAYLEEKVLSYKTVPYESELNKLKTALSMICILAFETDFMREMLSCLDINRLDQVYEDVRDKEFLKEMDMRLKYIVDILQNSKENLGGKIIREIKSDPQSQIKDEALYWRNLSGLQKRLGDEEIAILENSMIRKKRLDSEKKEKL